MNSLRIALYSACLSVLGCGGGNVPGKVDIAAAMANGDCEEASAKVLAINANMLPGRICQNCHVSGGQAVRADLLYTASGTVFQAGMALCNTGGLANATIEILDPAGKLLDTMTSNAIGNFYTTKPFSFPIKARVLKDGIERTMVTPVGSGACSTCHQRTGNAGGRLYLSL